jgi:hypothetical protein
MSRTAPKPPQQNVCPLQGLVCSAGTQHFLPRLPKHVKITSQQETRRPSFLLLKLSANAKATFAPLKVVAVELPSATSLRLTFRNSQVLGQKLSSIITPSLNELDQKNLFQALRSKASRYSFTMHNSVNISLTYNLILTLVTLAKYKGNIRAY